MKVNGKRARPVAHGNAFFKNEFAPLLSLHMQAPSKSTRLSSVAAAVRVLKCFSEIESEIGISSLAKRLNIAKSTAHRLAVTLLSEGLLEQNPENGRYRLGINLFIMGALVRRRLDVSNMAQPFLNVLRERTGETIHLAVLNETRGRIVLNRDSGRFFTIFHKPCFLNVEDTKR